MAKYRVLMWRDIPTAIQAKDATGARVKRQMPKWFMQEISRTTLREGLQGSDDYTAAYEWSAETEREGTAEEVVDAVYVELCAKFGRDLTGRRLARRGDAPVPDAAAVKAAPKPKAPKAPKEAEAAPEVAEAPEAGASGEAPTAG